MSPDLNREEERSALRDWETGQPKPVNFWYLATPYTRYHEGHDAAYELAREAGEQLTQAGIPFFGPIVHSHAHIPSGAEHLRLGHDFWMKMDGPFMDAAGGLLVVMALGWRQSEGMTEEIKRFDAANKPIVYWDPRRPLPIDILNNGDQWGEDAR